MNVSYKRSIATSLIFGILFCFLVTFFAVVGPEHYLEGKIYLVISSALVLISCLAFVLMLLLTNKKENIVDERDSVIQKKASSVGLIVSLMYVFLLSIVLFITYRDEGVLNVSWTWFIAYSTFAFGYFCTSLTHVFFYHYEG